MKNQITIEGDSAYVTLTKGYFTIIDASDVELVSPHIWRACEIRRKDGSLRHVYAITHFYRASGKRGALGMHRLIMGSPTGMEIDHQDSDSLNNTRDNLRICTHIENMCNQRTRQDNTSGFKGVDWHAKTKKWRVQIQVNGKNRHLGLYDSVEEAAQAYDAAAIALHGDYARLNAPAA